MFSGGGGGGFGRGRGARGQRGADLAAEHTLPFRTAVEGATIELSVEGRKVTARIPAGVHDGQKLRLRGKGRPGSGGSEAGDLVITVHVRPHPVFSLQGHDLRMTVPVTFAEAALGTQVDVPTLDGARVTVKIPPGTPSGRVLRIKGHGVRAASAPQGASAPPGGGAPRIGDLLVAIQVVVPQKLSAKAKEALAAFSAETHEDVRADLAVRVAEG
jgi:molecular chaperone DnaJ